MAFLERNANRGSISTQYDIDNSLKFESDNSEYLTKTYSSAGNSKTWTLSVWVKRTELGMDTGTSHMIFGAGDTYLHFLSNDKLYANLRTASTNFFWGNDRLYRDTAAWYHIVMAVDTTQGTAADRVKVYVNGIQETPTETSYNNISQNADTRVNSANEHEIGKYTFAEIEGMQYAEYFSGYMAEMHVIDGSAKLPTDFGRFDGSNIWVPKAYAGTYGTNGFYLNFDDSSSSGNDSSGNNNDFADSGISEIDHATDTPTNNFCIMNNNARTNGNIKASHGGTYVSTSGGSGYCSMTGTMGMSKGKWYWEAKFHNDSGETNTVFLGIAAANDPWIPSRQGGYYLGNVATGGSTGWYFVNGAVYNGGGTWTDGAGNGPGYGDILMVAYDADNTTLYFGKNGTWLNSSNPANNSNGIELSSYYWTGHPNLLDHVLPAITVYQGDYMRSMNFGAFNYWNDAISSANADANGYGSFEYAPPTGFYSLCSKNLAEFG